MKESTFIEKNEKDWRQLEDLLKQPRKDADKLLHLFEKVSGDLAYARTYYPNRSIRVYLNNLTQEVLNTLVKKREKFQLSSVLDFYRKELPAEIYRSRKAFYTSFVVFVLAVLIGVVSSANVEDFCNIILGDAYVEMTDENINKGDPMAVYKKMEQGDMFMRITVNNIRVSFLCFVMGLLGSLGTIIILLSNGIMVGAFQYYFYKKGLFMTSFLTIWIHGTIEISSIILAGAAGIILGNGLLFPKSYSRNASLLISAKRALRIILAILPLFVIAGFLESFVTRLTDMPTIIKVLIILISLLFILLTFVVYPIYCARNGLLQQEDYRIDPVSFENLEFKKYSHVPFGTSVAAALSGLRSSIGPFMSQILLPFFPMLCLLGYLMLKFKIMAQVGLPSNLDFRNFDSGAWPFSIGVFLLTSFLFVWLILRAQEIETNMNSFLVGLKKYFLKVAPLSGIFVLGYFHFYNDFIWLVFLLIPVHFVFAMLEELAIDKRITFAVIIDRYVFSFRYWLDFLPITLFAGLCILTMALISETQLIGIITNFIGWHNIFGNKYADGIFVTNIIDVLVYFFSIPLLYFLFTYRYTSIRSLVSAEDLYEKLIDFGESESTYQLGR